jgi:nucleoid DNA-binding protein
MLYKEFITAISKKINMPKKNVSKYSVELINIINKSVQKGNPVEIEGFGRFLKGKNGKMFFEANPEFVKEINIK